MPPSTSTATGPGDRVWLPWAAAGLLFVLSLAMTWQIASMAREQVRLTERVEALEAPRGNVSLVYLDAPRRDAADDATVAASDEPVVLIVTPDDPASHPAYELRLERRDGSEVWRGGGLTPDEHGALRLGLPRLDRGVYRVTVRPEGLEASAAAAVEYRLEVR